MQSLQKVWVQVVVAVGLVKGMLGYELGRATTS